MAINNVTPLQVSSIGTVTAVSVSATPTLILPSNEARNGATFFNNSTTIIYLSFSNTVSSSLFSVRLTGNSYFELPKFTGEVWAIRAASIGDVLITEYT